MAESIIILELQGRQTFVDAVSYKDALDAFLGLLQEIDSNATLEAGGRGHSLKWLIRSLHTSNPTMELIPESIREEIDVGPKVVKATLDTLAILQDKPQRPSWVTYAGLEKCQYIANIITRDNIAEFIVRSQIREVRVSAQLDVNIRQIMGEKVEMLSSVEGELEMVTFRGRHYFNVYSIVTGRATRCYFGDNMKELVRQALDRLVTVKGLVRSFAQEEGQEITEVTAIEIHADETLPSPDDIRGIMPNLTGGKPSEQYLKERWRGKT